MRSRLVYFLILFFSNNFISSALADDDNLYLIRSAASSLVLDGTNGKVTIQYFDGYTPQLWKFKLASLPGLFHIINNSTGTVLDVGNDNFRIILAQKGNDLKQQWYIHSNGRIVNAGHSRNLDIIGAKYTSGNYLIAHIDNGSDAQKFTIKEKLTCCPSICTTVSTIN